MEQPSEVATDEETCSSAVFNTNVFMRNEMPDVERPKKKHDLGNPAVGKVEGRVRRQLLTSSKKLSNQGLNFGLS